MPVHFLSAAVLTHRQVAIGDIGRGRCVGHPLHNNEPTSSRGVGIQFAGAIALAMGLGTGTKQAQQGDTGYFVGCSGLLC